MAATMPRAVARVAAYLWRERSETEIPAQAGVVVPTAADVQAALRRRLRPRTASPKAMDETETASTG